MSDQLEATPVSESQDPQAQDQAQTTQSSVVQEAVASSGTAEGAEASGTLPVTVASQDSSEGVSGPETAKSSDGHVSSEEDAADSPATNEEAATAADGDADGAKRKRRRKRKRKGDDDGTADAVTSVDGSSVSSKNKGKSKKDPANAPFAALFAGGAGKRHAFSAGEVVAGRVLEIKDGTISVDLFGKAVAFVDEHEPRDVPPVPPTVDKVTVDSAKPAGVPDDAAVENAQETSQLPTLREDKPEGAPGTASNPELTQQADAAASESPEVAAPVADENLSESSENEAPVDAPAADSASSGQEAKGQQAPAPVVPVGFSRLEAPALGSVFKGRVGSVSESGHIVLVNRNVVKPEVRAAVAIYREQRRRVEGLVYGYNRGGFDVLVEGVRAFCPASAMSLHDLRNPDEFLGRKFEFLLPASKTGKDIVVSRRSILEREARKRAKELLRSLTAGQELEGIVSSVRDFGLFVDIGGLEGLVHQSEVSHSFGVKPSDAAKVGDTVKVKVLRVGAEGQKKGDKKDRVTRVSLSIKALQADPWDSHAELIAEGSVREGKVTRTTDFGAFIELAPSIEGLLHISELGRELKHANEAIAEGEAVVVIIERTDRKAHRISLSKLSQDDVELFRAGSLVTDGGPKNMRPGAKINVAVEKADNRGIQVKVAGVIGRRSRGFVPASETGTDRGSDLRKRFPAGQELEVKIIGNDRDGGLKCSIKALAIDEERKAVKDYRREASKQGFGTFGDLLKAKLSR